MPINKPSPIPCEALLDLDPALGDEWLWMLPPADVCADAAGVVHAEVAFRADSHKEDRPPLKRTLRFRAYGGVVVRVSLDGTGSGDPGARTSLKLASDDALCFTLPVGAAEVRIMGKAASA